jgi:hypothetical protein
LSRCGNPLPGDAPCDSHSNAQRAADIPRIHSVYDGSSGLGAVRARAAPPGLLSNGNGSKVKILCRSPHSLPRGRSWRYS